MTGGEVEHRPVEGDPCTTVGPDADAGGDDAWGHFAAEGAETGYLQFGEAYMTPEQLECVERMKDIGPSLRARRGRERNLQKLVTWTSGHGDEDYWEEIADNAFSTPRAYTRYISIIPMETRYDFLTNCIENRLSIIKPGFEAKFLEYLTDEVDGYSTRDASCAREYTLSAGEYDPLLASDEQVAEYRTHKRGEETEMWPAWRGEIKGLEDEERVAAAKVRDAEFEAASGGPLDDETISRYTGRKVCSTETQTVEDFSKVFGEAAAAEAAAAAAADDAPSPAEPTEGGDKDAQADSGDNEEFYKTAKGDEEPVAVSE